MGFRRCIMPAANIDPDAGMPPVRQVRSGEPRPRSPDSPAGGGGTGAPSNVDECELIGVRTVAEALDALIA
jgi:hypothetical protein